MCHFILKNGMTGKMSAVGGTVSKIYIRMSEKRHGYSVNLRSCMWKNMETFEPRALSRPHKKRETYKQTEREGHESGSLKCLFS